ncbi:hypothetical protein, partial [Ralstonia pseudosolanacearum]|uniref:hypothetical protein n=1 Tax=Ralstonia pseudosolanacearum TaxID=1310165 RepID=UPI003C7EA950
YAGQAALAHHYFVGKRPSVVCVSQPCGTAIAAVRYRPKAAIPRCLVTCLPMHPVISAALDAICLERDDKEYSVSFDAAAAVVRVFGERDLANVLFSEIPRTVPFELVAQLFDLLAWQTNDNGASVTRTIEAWLREGRDNRKLLIALHLEVYPFIDHREMERVLSHLAETNFRVAARCKELMRSRRRDGHAG